VADIPRERWTATSRRQVLRDRLEKASTAQLAAFYVEAIRALREGDDQVRFSVAGHMLRELQGGLPKHLNVPQEKGRLGDFFAWLRVTWTALIQGRAEKSGDELWRGETVDGPVAKFLAMLHDKIEKAAGIRPRKRDEHSAMLGKLDPTLGDAPETVRGEIVTTWMELNDIFNTATHTPTVDPEEFEKAVETFERLLEDRLVPRTVEKRDAIAAFVKEFEGRA
jgi:hypothetical protein